MEQPSARLPVDKVAVNLIYLLSHRRVNELLPKQGHPACAPGKVRV